MIESCRRFDGLIARSAQLTAAEVTELEAHLAVCASCRDLARAVKPVEDVAFAATNASGDMTGDTLASPARRSDRDPPDTAGATVASPLARRKDRDLPGTTTDRYRVTGEVGRGGIGRVLRALDQVLDRPVALKELFSANDGIRRRFLREALITARLQHPSIVPVYDVGEHDDQSPFYAMKLVAGRPLDKAIADATTLAQRLALLPTVLAIADAMAYAHSERIIHRDLKPTNVLVGKYGETIVIDWGLAKDLTVDDQDALDAGPYREAGLDHTVAGAVLGTPAYMAPEQAAGEPVDERADVYALGAILYHVISGAIPHEGTTLEDMVERVTTGAVRPLADRVPDVPRDLAAIVTKAMALAPSERYANAQGLAEDLRRYQTGQLVASHTYGTRELVRRWIRRHRGIVAVALAAVAVVSVIGVVSVQRIMRARRQADAAAALATSELAEMMIEQGRQELLAGRPARAAVYLSQAYSQTRDPGVGLRSLLADAMRTVEAERVSLEDPVGGERSAAFSADGTRVVTSGTPGRIWDAATGKVVTTLAGEDNFAEDSRSAALSTDGSRIVTVGWHAAVWDAGTGKQVSRLDAGDGLEWAAISSDGALVISAGRMGAPKLWDARTGQLLGALKGHRNIVHGAAFSRDGARVITTSEDRTAKVWDTKTLKVMLSLEGHRGPVSSAAFSPDGSQILTASADGTARLWDAGTGELSASLEGHTDDIVSAAYSPDGARVVTASGDHTAKVWDAHTGKLLTSLVGHTDEVNTAVFSPDGARVVTASNDNTARLWDAATGRLLASFEGHRDDVVSASFSPDGAQVVTSSMDGAVKLWDARPRKLVLSVDAGDGRPIVGDIASDGATVVTAARRDHVAKVWDARTGKLLASLDGHRADIRSAWFDAAGGRVVTASVDHTARLWDAKTGKLLFSLDHPGEVRRARFSADGARVVTVGANRNAWLWNAATGQLVAKLDSSDAWGDDSVGGAFLAEFSPDSSRLVTSTDFRKARIWRADNGQPVAELDDEHGAFLSAKFSHDGERVLTSGTGIHNTAMLWDARTGKLLTTFAGHTKEVFAASFSPDDARIVTASADHTARLWDARTGKLQASLDGHTDTVGAAVFSPDGARVVTASDDHTAKVWDAHTGKLLASLEGHSSDVTAASFTPDGTRVVTGSDDGTFRVWDVHLEQRTADEIRRVIGARDPWTLTNGGLVPVLPEHLRDLDTPTPDEPSPALASVPRPIAGGDVASNDDYAIRLSVLVSAELDVFAEPDCEKAAANIRSFLDTHAKDLAALAAWRKGHTVDEAAIRKAADPRLKDMEKIGVALEKCKDNKAFMDAVTASDKAFVHR